MNCNKMHQNRQEYLQTKWLFSEIISEVIVHYCSTVSSVPEHKLAGGQSTSASTRESQSTSVP